MKETILITDINKLQELYDLLEEYQMYDLNNSNSILTIGYKNVPSSAKDTYRILQNLQKINEKKGKYYIELSLDYLSTVFATSEECQAERLKKLEQAQLIQIHRRAYHINRYIVKEVIPDETFYETIIKLIARKNLGLLLAKYEQTNNIQEKVHLLQQIQSLSKNTSHFKLKKLSSITTNLQ